jgi:hypothetical protein
VPVDFGLRVRSTRLTSGAGSAVSRGKSSVLRAPQNRWMRKAVVADEHLTDEQGRLLADIFRREAFRHSSHDVRQYPEPREAPYRGGGDPDVSNLRSRQNRRRRHRADSARLASGLAHCLSRLPTHLRAIGQGSAANSEDGLHSLASWKDALEGALSRRPQLAGCT